ncbi:hypothetical protein Ndes2526B_g05596 [Nannochloris sp. 'desiccata']|nr:hypothetical protein KSW81_007451 [Chlorella desiccata (nom. nud.)]KAH7618681.1 putative 10 kDa chaperonin [Chlorella desiccata (nom. nud.)]
MAIAMSSVNASVARPSQGIARSFRSSRNVAFVNAGRRTSRNLRNFQIQAVLTADAGLDVSQMAPLGDRLLVKPKEKEEKTAGGILLTSSSTPRMEDALIGTVMAVGDEVDIGVSTGDMVLFTKYGSSDIEVPNGEVCFVAQKSILAKLS